MTKVIQIIEFLNCNNLMSSICIIDYKKNIDLNYN